MCVLHSGVELPMVASGGGGNSYWEVVVVGAEVLLIIDCGDNDPLLALVLKCAGQLGIDSPWQSVACRIYRNLDGCTSFTI